MIVKSLSESLLLRGHHQLVLHVFDGLKFIQKLLLMLGFGLIEKLREYFREITFQGLQVRQWEHQNLSQI